MVPPIVEPSYCSVTYECAMSPISPRSDLCTDSSSGFFDTTTGNYEFYASDPSQYPTGDYVFEITASVGAGPMTSVQV